MDNSTGIQKKKATRSIYYFFGSLVVALALTFLLKEPTFTDSQVYALFLLFFVILLWITEAIPPFAVSLFIFAYLENIRFKTQEYTYCFNVHHHDSGYDNVGCCRHLDGGCCHNTFVGIFG